MRVRVKQNLSLHGTRWNIEVKHWWWPFWKLVDYWDDEETALKKAEIVKRPKTVEVL